MSRLRRLATNLSVAGSAIIVLCLVLEATLAVVKINSRAATVFDREKGITFSPGAYYVNRKEGFSEGHFNSHGFRDAERTWKKPPNTYRILVLGDSFVEAFNVPLERTFPALLEAKLNAASSSRRFEVLALGQSGFGTADEYMRYVNYGVRYSPDMVILAFFTGNDVRDNSRFLSRDWIRFYFVIDEQGRLVLDRSLLDRYADRMTPPHRGFQAIKRHSYLLSLISERAFWVRRQMEERRLEQAQAHAGQAGLDEFADFNVYLPEPPSRWTEAWDITEKALVKFAGEVASRGTPFVLVILGAAEQVHPELQQELRKEYGLPFDFDLPDRRLREVAAQHGIRTLDLMPAFRNHHQRTRTYLHGSGSVITGHWNEAGHRVAAEDIFAFLRGYPIIP